MKKYYYLGLFFLALTFLLVGCSRREIPVLTADDLGPPPIDQLLPYWAQTDWDYFSAAEAHFNGIMPGRTTVEELLYLLGEPDIIEPEADPSLALYHYADASFGVDGIIVRSITIHRNSEAFKPRNIMIGDLFEEVIRKFPHDHDFRYPNAQGIHLLYGQITDGNIEPVASLNRNQAGEFYRLVVSAPEGHFMRFYFNNGRVSSILISHSLL